ncbi:MAG: UDP-N-acetylmuramoyl-L-alanine--D-glutamate ligase, partial [Planctomycetota bacterium]
PNHLDRYGTFEAYCASKEHIFHLQNLNEQQPAISIFNADDKVGCEWYENYKNDKGRICIKFSADDVSRDIRNCYALPGRANLSNLAAALRIARHYGVTEETIKKALPQFHALAHRLELIAEHQGVKWYNDSKATTPESTMVALEAFEAPQILIAGGYDKHLPFDQLGAMIAEKAKAAILIGQTKEKIAQAIRHCPANNTMIEFADSLELAVEKAASIADTGDVVILSPACASYDMFDNFQHRGRKFTKLVKELP